ncbi:hypothetical protein HN865_01245 [Candidatus Woesearchaeota archaeon]|jgi:hypothetical protein|nr:hypothetical protein [Candidatus Woesearchaeota archaeon]
MKKGLILLLFSSVFLIGSLGIVSAYCTDTDGGYNLNVKGRVSDITGYESDDSCGGITAGGISGTPRNIIEYSCGADGEYDVDPVLCPDGQMCENGACVFATCTDSDGDNFAVQGEVVTSEGTYTDYCLADDQVNEYVCLSHPDGYDYKSEITHICSQDQGCDEGTCWPPKYLKITPYPIGGDDLRGVDKNCENLEGNAIYIENRDFLSGMDKKKEYFSQGGILEPGKGCERHFLKIEPTSKISEGVELQSPLFVYKEYWLAGRISCECSNYHYLGTASLMAEKQGVIGKIISYIKRIFTKETVTGEAIRRGFPSAGPNVAFLYGDGGGRPKIEFTTFCDDSDINLDGKVNEIDLQRLMDNYGRTDCLEINEYCERADIDRDLKVDGGDLTILNQWMDTPLC